MATCTRCKKEYVTAPPLMYAPCPKCGYDPSKSKNLEQIPSVDFIRQKKFTGRLADVNTMDLGLDATSKEIVDLVGTKDKVTKDRVIRVLKIFRDMHTNAQAIAAILTELTPNTTASEKTKITAQLDEALRKRDPDGTDLLAAANYARFGASPSALRDYLMQGWQTVKGRWPGLNDRAKVKLIEAVFEHDKGYPQSLQSALTFVPPEDFDLAGAMMAILFDGRNTDIFTGWSINRSISTSQNLSTGWSLAIVDSDGQKKRNNDPKFNLYKNMWGSILYRLAKAIDDYDPGQLKAQLVADRAAFVQSFSGILPAKDVDDFLDNHFDAAWDMIMNPKDVVRIPPSHESVKGYREAIVK